VLLLLPVPLLLPMLKKKLLRRTRRSNLKMFRFDPDIHRD
jgi:hypothetical protein